MNKVIVREEIVTIPTYETAPPSDLPMFLDNRIYEGGSGRIYPHPITDKVSDTKTNKKYSAIYLENEYLLVTVLPELGGKIQRIYDKTNGFDSVYQNHVIKPALVGLSGPWLGGGITFNWPQYHKASAYTPTDCTIEENDDGSVTVWCGELEKMYHIKGMTGFTLKPGRAYLEVHSRIYNPTERPLTFMWWTNSAFAASEHTSSVLPPDVHVVSDPLKRAFSKFPVATGEFCNADYSEGVNISQYKNIPVPTSYMSYESNYDFVGNFDYSADAGLLHVADRHISPCKMQQTQGYGELGKARYGNLTDTDDSYVELLTGVYSNSRSDLSFIKPYEEKSFVQYFIPYKSVGAVKNATKDLLVNLELDNGKAMVSVYATHMLKTVISLTGEITEYINEPVTLSPDCAFLTSAAINEEDIKKLTLRVCDSDNNVLISYSPQIPADTADIPSPQTPPDAPENISSLEELYLTAVHLEQYRHAAYSPEPYYTEGLRRDGSDIRLNNGYGRLLYKNARFKEAKAHFEAAIKKATMKNPNPYSCEPYYNLGLTLRRLHDIDGAYDAFFKATWDSSVQDKAFFQLACLAAAKKDFNTALEFCDKSLAKGMNNLKARDLKTSLLRLLGRLEEARDFAFNTVLTDPLDYGARYELYRITDDFKYLNELTVIMRNDVQNYLELSLNYNDFGLYDEAAKVLAIIAELKDPMLHYYIAYYSNSQKDLEIAAEEKNFVYYPNRLTEIRILEYAIKHNPSDSNAPYLLANLYYDKGCTDTAVKYWEKAVEIASANGKKFPYAHRNLAIAYFNKRYDGDTAAAHMAKALRYAPENPRIFAEADQLDKRLNILPKRRLKNMADNLAIVGETDDLYVEFITLLNFERHFERADKAIELREFHPRTGGEGRISVQYRKARIGMAKELLKKNDFEDASRLLLSALTYPENLGEGKPITETDNDIYYYLGLTYEKTDLITANEYFAKAAAGSDNLSDISRNSDCRAAEMYFFRAMAFKKLGNKKKAKGMFNHLIDFGAAHMNDDVRINYFTEATPGFIIFDTDLNAENKAHCAYMISLGLFGKNEIEKAKKYILTGLGYFAAHEGLNELKYEVE